MEYFKASEEHAEQIYNLVQNTITAVYPRYYPEAVVDFFCSLHNRTNISRDIEDGCVRSVERRPDGGNRKLQRQPYH